MQIAFRWAGIPQSPPLLYVYFFLSELSVRRIAASELTITRVLPSCENSVGRAWREGKHYRRLRNFPRHRARGTSCRGDRVREQGRGMKRTRGDGRTVCSRARYRHRYRRRIERPFPSFFFPQSFFSSLCLPGPSAGKPRRLYRRWRPGW